MDTILGFVIFVVSLLSAVYFCGKAWHAFRSPEFKADLERLREQRRQRVAARRNPR
jgi:hypothetical protein